MQEQNQSLDQAHIHTRTDAPSTPFFRGKAGNAEVAERDAAHPIDLSSASVDEPPDVVVVVAVVAVALRAAGA